MIVPYRVLLPKWIFETCKSEKEVMAKVQIYMQRYPHYSVLRIENGFALCSLAEKYL